MNDRGDDDREVRLDADETEATRADPEVPDVPLVTGLAGAGSGFGVAAALADDDDEARERGRPSGTSDEPIQNG